MSKRAADRYTTAKDMADDLRHFLQQLGADARLAMPLVQAGEGSGASTPSSTRTSDGSTTPGSQQELIRVVPKGLRSFDAHDSDFFLNLLAGPRDRDGLPESIRFWKKRIESRDVEGTFSVGMIYGPSGSGKSSLVKAGLLPRLASDVIPVYLEATASETEARLLSGLHRQCPLLSSGLGLADTLKSLRRGRDEMPGLKVLIVLDQFEQWLHSHKEIANTELVQALRHCDGEHVQCLILVRDDFWLAVSRFFRDLEVDLAPDQNVTLVDLFDLDHARRMLGAFGRAYGKLPERPSDMTREQKDFLRQAVAELAQDGKVICIRLALFAEMMKGRDWTAAALKEVGGTGGIGVRFLEDTFTAPAANPKHRAHQKAARAVLKELLPESGSDIKGNMRSETELLAASGYAERRGEFAELIRVLDAEVRLITPTDPAGSDNAGDNPEARSTGEKYYQLTHDYMVPSLRDWLTRKQRESRQGRAELRLAERTATWSNRPERRYLPSVLEWLKIRLFTRRRMWTLPQRNMMGVAGRYHLLRLVLALLFVSLIGLGINEYRAEQHARTLKQRLASADITEVRDILQEMQSYQERVAPLLREALASETDPRKKLFLRMGLVRSDREQISYLVEELLQASPENFAVLRDVLAPYKVEFVEKLWSEFADRQHKPDRGFRAACALIAYSADDSRWPECANAVVNGLIAENPFMLSHWEQALEPVRKRLVPALAESLEDNKWSPSDRRALIEFCREFSGDEIDSADVIERKLVGEHFDETVVDAKRQANLAAALVALGKAESAWPLLVLKPDPTVRSFLIERLAVSDVDPRTLRDRLAIEPDVSARRRLFWHSARFHSAAPSSSRIGCSTSTNAIPIPESTRP